MSPRLAVAWTAAVTALAAVLLTAPAVPALSAVQRAAADTASTADVSVPLTQLTAFHQMLVDEQAGFIFLSEGQDSVHLLTNGTDFSPGIVVTDLSGNYVTTVDAGRGAEGMALSSDGGTLYAAMGPQNTIAVIDVSSIGPSVTEPAQTFMRLNGWEVPYSLAAQSGKLWVSYNPMQDSPPGDSHIGYFDLSAASPVFQDAASSQGPAVPDPNGWYAAPELAADPADSGVLVAADSTSAPALMATYDVAGPTVTSLASQQFPSANGDNQVCGFVSNMTVLPGGQYVVPGCGGYEFPVSDLAAPVRLPLNMGLGDYVLSRDSGLIALGTGDTSGPDIYVYQPGSPAPVNAYDFGYSTTSPEDVLTGGGLALSADGSKMWAITAPYGGTANYTLHIFDAPEQPQTSVTLNGPATAYAGPVTLTGAVTFANGPAPAQLKVSVTRTGPDGTVSLPQATIGAGGIFTVQDSPATPGSYTYTASYLGLQSAVIAQASLTIAVAPNTTVLTLSGPSSTKASVSLSGTLTFDGVPAPAGTPIAVTRTVEPTLDPNSGTALPTVTTGAGGKFTITDKPGFPNPFLYTATYAGSASHGYATAGVTVIVTKLPCHPPDAPQRCRVAERVAVHE